MRRFWRVRIIFACLSSSYASSPFSRTPPTISLNTDFRSQRFTQYLKKSSIFHPPFTSPKARFRADENIIPSIFFFFKGNRSYLFTTQTIYGFFYIFIDIAKLLWYTINALRHNKLNLRHCIPVFILVHASEPG